MRNSHLEKNQPIYSELEGGIDTCLKILEHFALN